MKEWLFGIMLCAGALPNANAQAHVSIDMAKRLKVLYGIENGINVDYLMDGDFTKPVVPLGTALKNMGVTLVRYPGGEKSDNYLWSAAPWTAASPRMALRDTLHAWPTKDNLFVYKSSAAKLCKPVVLDFDEFMTQCSAAGAKPLIVVAYDGMYNTKTALRPTKKELLANAVEWVRYANVVKKFGIKYWMIGNESWNNPEYNGKVSAAKYAADVYDFAVAMKAVDPTIKIIANGISSWWPTLLKSKAVSVIDILAFSLYPVDNYKYGYDNYRMGTQNLTGEADAAINAINNYAPAADRSRLKVLPSEYNSLDWSESWKSANNLGHALCNFQMFGDLIIKPKVVGACLWNTRWITNQTAPQNLTDALDKSGNLNASGTALGVWGKNLLNTMVSSASSDARVKVYTTYDTATRNATIFIINKELFSKTIALSVSNYVSGYSGSRYVFRGTSVNDVFPKYSLVSSITNPHSISTLTLAPASVTVLKLTPVQAASVTLSHASGKEAAA